MHKVGKKILQQKDCFSSTCSFGDVDWSSDNSIGIFFVRTPKNFRSKCKNDKFLYLLQLLLFHFVFFLDIKKAVLTVLPEILRQISHFFLIKNRNLPKKTVFCQINPWDMLTEVLKTLMNFCSPENWNVIAQSPKTIKELHLFQ